MSESPSKLQRAAARNIVTKYLKVHAGENAIVESWNHTLPMAAAMVDEVRRVGGSALLIHEDEEAWWRAIDRKQSKLLGKSSAPEWAALRAADVYVNFWGPADTDRIEKDHEYGDEKTFDDAFAWTPAWYGVARKVGLRGVRMTGAFATEGRAKEWSVDQAKWEESVLRAALVDPGEIAQRGARLARTLVRGKKVRIMHPNGTNLEVGLAGVAPRVQDGRPRAYRKGDSLSGMLQMCPAGTVDVALDPGTGEGSFRANRRTNIWWHWHAGGSLEFVGGKLTSHEFRAGEEPFGQQCSKATAGKDRPSVLKFGLNPVVMDVPNLETVEGGAVTLQVGGNRYLGGSNHSNFFTWFTLADAEIAVDGTPIVRDGKVL